MDQLSHGLEPGTRIDRYVLSEPLGEGGFGAVYRARHEVLGHEVALKLLHPEHTADGEMLERFFREARASTAIGSRHIVHIHDCGTSAEGWHFLAMELLEGASLEAVIHETEPPTPLAVERALSLILQTLESLTAAHAAGIIHRDLKPANIFLARDPSTGEELVKLLDFGVSKITGAQEPALTQSGAMLGTPLYMAPEQFHNARDIDHRVDVYSAAAVLYEMLSGRVPFDALTYADLVVQICCEAVKPLSSVAPHVPRPLAEVVMKGLAQVPDARWPDAESFAAALRDAASAGAVAGDVGASRPGFATAPGAPLSMVGIGLSQGPATAPPPLGHPVTGGATPSSTPGFPSMGVPSGAPDAPAATGSRRRLGVWVGLVALIVAAVTGGGLLALFGFSGGEEPRAASPAVAPAAPAPVAPAPPVSSAGSPAPPPLDDPLSQIVHGVLGSVGEELAGGGGSPMPGDASTGVQLFQPRAVGQVDLNAVRQVLLAAQPAMSACRVAGAPVTVRLQVSVSLGQIVALGPSSTNTGRAETVRCVGDAFRGAVPGAWNPGQGMIFFDVALAAR